MSDYALSFKLPYVSVNGCRQNVPPPPFSGPLEFSEKN